jgi:hypothetical protein
VIKSVFSGSSSKKVCAFVSFSLVLHFGDFWMSGTPNSYLWGLDDQLPVGAIMTSVKLKRTKDGRAVISAVLGGMSLFG